MTLASALALLPLAPVAQAEPNAKPVTIPALREWSGGRGGFTLGGSSRIVVAPSQRSVHDDARLFAADLATLTGRQLPVAIGGAEPGDVELRLGSPDTGLGREGYRLSIADTVVVSARTDTGAFYGTRTLLQLFRQSATLPTGTARDWPRYPERGLMVDVARRIVSMDWLASHIRELAYLKLNYLHLHLSDDQGFRLESERHPEITSEQHYTKTQIRQLVALAARHHITVVPEIDMPGHMAAALEPYPEYQLRNVAGSSGLRPKLDITKPAARDFATSLVTEFAPLFPGPYFHIGADEFMYADSYAFYPQIERYAKRRYGPDATPSDAVVGFVNEADAVVRSLGKTTRSWNDGIDSDGVVTANPAITVDWWADSALSPRELLARGHDVMNAGYYPTYYVVGPHEQTNNLRNNTEESAYESWEVHRFVPEDTGTTYLVHPGEPRNLGSKVHLWGDWNAALPYETEEQSAAGIAGRLRIIAQHTWRSDRLTDTWAAFQPMINAVGHAPGYTAAD